MQNNFTVFQVWGIPIRVNVSLLVFLPILVWLVGSGEQISAYVSLIDALTPATVDPAALSGSNDRWIIGAGAAVALFGSVAVHELGHAWAAMRYDIETESITLWILGGLADLAEMPKEWNRELWIAVAGPITSVLLGLSAVAALAVIPSSATRVVFLVGFVAVMNIVLAIFNMVPAFPMDGGRVLRALLARRRSYVKATQTAARIGTYFALLFAVFGIVVVFSPILLLLAAFIYVAATSESRSVLVGELLSGLSVSDLIADYEAVPADVTVADLFDRLLGARRTDLAVVDKDGTVVGAVTASTLRTVPTQEYETTTVGSIATTDLPRFDSGTSAFDALSELTGSRRNVAIVERDGAAVGLVSREDFNDVLALRRNTAAVSRGR